MHNAFPSRSALLAVAAAVVLSALPALQSPAAAAEWTSLGRGATVVVRGVPGDGRHSAVPPVDRSGRQVSSLRQGEGAAAPRALSSTALSDIQVTYTSAFSANSAAVAAFEAAVSIWEHAVASSVPIGVDASLANLGTGVLGFAGPTNFIGDSAVLYPVALANALQGINRPGAEIDAQFSNNASAFYYGTDGNTPAGKYDFMTVALHELGHGLGFIGSVDQAPGAPQANYNSPPFIYDVMTGTSDGTPILDRANNSAALTAAVTSDQVYWFGPHAASADHGREPRLYAPSTGFESGSSYSHLSEADYPQNDPDALMRPGIATGDAIHDPGEVMLGMFRDMGWVTPGLPGSTYTAILPTRLLDTGSIRVPGGAIRDLPVTGTNGVPSNATAVVVNLTSDRPTSANVLRAYPLGRSAEAPVPLVSNLNTGTGDTRANLATVAVGRGGRIRLLTTGGATRLVVDLAGYYAPTGGSSFTPRTPIRVMDTRDGTGVPKAPVGPGQTVTLQVSGGSVPAGATAAVLTLTAVNPTATTYVTAYPADGTAGTSNINVSRGATTANQVMVKLSPDGKATFRNNVGAVHLLADLAGWFVPGAGGALFRPALAQRLIDTRPTRLGPGGTSDVALSELVDASWGVPSGATAAVINLTGVGPTAPTHLQVYPATTAVPTTSNLNLAVGQTAAASATVLLGNGRIRVRNSAGTVPFIVDLQGWYGPA